MFVSFPFYFSLTIMIIIKFALGYIDKIPQPLPITLIHCPSDEVVATIDKLLVMTSATDNSYMVGLAGHAFDNNNYDFAQIFVTTVRVVRDISYICMDI